MADWFILYTRTGAEERVLETLKRYVDSDIYTPFIPYKELPHIEKGKITKEKKICFPGYVFVSSLNGVEDFLQNIVPYVYRIKEAYYFLYYGSDKKDIALREYEKVYIEQLLNADFCMESSIGFIEGDRVHVTRGALEGLDSKIKRINTHKRTAVIEIEVMGSFREVTLMLECMEKVK